MVWKPILKLPHITEFPMSKVRVLVVYDKAMIRDGIQALLGLHDDIEVVGEASEGREAIEKAQELAPDVMLIDITAPGPDVLNTIRHLRKKNSKVKVLALTNHDNREEIVFAIRAGSAGCVSKRAPGSELISAIRALQRGEFFLYPSALETVIADYRQLKNAQPHDQLTPRQRDVLKLVAEGYTSREIADILHANLKTIQGHLATTMTKLDIHNRAKLVKYAIRSGLVTLE